jgi:quercetin dioxygenase-like cupin family protein
MKFRSALTVMILALSGFQDPVVLNPKMVSVVFENDRVRVLRVHYGPREHLEMHSHPSLVVVSLTVNTRRAYIPDGSHRDATSNPGDVHWREPSIHSVENLTDTPSESIEIEFKNARTAAVPLSPAGPPVSSEPSMPVPVQQEPHHHVMFENQYVRVLNVEIAPGESTFFHTHAHDNLAVRITDGLSQTQERDQDWAPASHVKAGSVVFSEGSSKPYTHRVKNLGTSTYHVIDVELFP